jgi:hypothetical protein
LFSGDFFRFFFLRCAVQQNNFTLLDSSFTESGDDDDDDLVELYIERFSAVHKRNQQLFWPNVCVVIVDVCIALASLCLPPVRATVDRRLAAELRARVASQEDSLDRIDRALDQCVARRR